MKICTRKKRVEQFPHIYKQIRPFAAGSRCAECGVRYIAGYGSDVSRVKRIGGIFKSNGPAVRLTQPNLQAIMNMKPS